MTPTTRVALLVGLQLLIVLGVLAIHAFTVVTGDEVLLEAAPVDPRDPFRGDYLALRYEITRLTVADATRYQPGDRVYVLLGPSGVHHEALSAHRGRPDLGDGEACIRGTVTTSEATVRPPYIETAYGIESYFVPEGAGVLPPGEVHARVRLDVFCRPVLVGLLVDGEPWRPTRPQ